MSSSTLEEALDNLNEIFECSKRVTSRDIITKQIIVWKEIPSMNILSYKLEGIVTPRPLYTLHYTLALL